MITVNNHNNLQNCCGEMVFNLGWNSLLLVTGISHTHLTNDPFTRNYFPGRKNRTWGQHIWQNITFSACKLFQSHYYPDYYYSQHFHCITSAEAGRSRGRSKPKPFLCFTICWLETQPTIPFSYPYLKLNTLLMNIH